MSRRPRSTSHAHVLRKTKRVLGIIANAIAIGLFAYLCLLVALRPWHRNLGSTTNERQRVLPGDEHAGDPARAGNRSIAIDAPAPIVWSWLVQIGQDRGGFYSYASLENAVGVHIANTEQIVPEWQTLKPGDFVRATQPDWAGGIFGDRVGWEVDYVVPNRVLALRYWIFEIEPTSSVTSRLHVRTHAADMPVPVTPLIFALFEPAHGIMEHRMLVGIKERAESTWSSREERRYVLRAGQLLPTTREDEN